MAELINEQLLTLILFTPLAGMVAVALVPADNKSVVRWVALLASLVPFGLSVFMWFAYPAATANAAGFRFVEQFDWYAVINSQYHLGVDGISVPMVILTTFLTPLGVLASFNIEDRPKAFMMLFLMLETGVLGVFVSLDLLMYFLFYEIGLVPMYFLINIWGSKNRQYASFKFFVYTMAGSLGLLLSIQLIGVTAGTFNITELMTIWPGLSDEPFPGIVSLATIKTITFWTFVIAFSIKVPLWPLHTWLPDAHTEAPTAGSMILAGVLLKLGAYGFLRLVLPLFPEQAKVAAGVIAVFAMLAIVLGAFAAYGQRDFKRLVAYSSINHMGFVMLGIAAVAALYGTSSESDTLTATIAGTGVVLQMVNHGLSAAAMFFLVGIVYDRTHTRDLGEIGGGIWQYAPIYGGIMIFSSMASLGLPGLNGFVSEFAIIRGAWPVFTTLTALSMLGLLFTGAYILKGVASVLHGPANEKWADRGMEIKLREVLVIAPLMVFMLWIGIYPFWLSGIINSTIQAMVG